jgi:hypothetical protein
MNSLDFYINLLGKQHTMDSKLLLLFDHRFKVLTLDSKLLALFNGNILSWNQKQNSL